MLIRKFLYFALAIMIVSVPVFQAAHALTHVSDIDTINLVQVDNGHQEDDDFDQICLDCLALTAFNIISAIFAYFFINLIRLGVLRKLKHRPIYVHFFSIYLKRAPPLA